MSKAKPDHEREHAFRRGITANMPDVAAFLLDEDLRILMAEGTGVQGIDWFDTSLFQGRRVQDLYGEVPAEVLDVAVAHYRAAVAGERREFTFDVGGLTFSVVAAPVAAGAGEGGRARAVVVARDVTELTRAGRELQRAEAMQRTLSRNIPDTSVGLLDEDLRWLILEGETVLATLGATKEAVEGTILGGVHGELGALVRPLALRALEGERGATEWRSPTGGWFSIHTAPVVGVTGSPNVLVAVTDMSERRAVEARADTMYARFERAFEFAPIGMMLVDLSGPRAGHIVRANRALGDLLGYGHEELASMALDQLTHPAHHDLLSEQMRRMIGGEIETLSTERRYVTKDGDVCDVWLSASLLPADGQGGRLALAHVQDLTQRNRAETAREQARAQHERMQEALHQFQKLETVGQLAGGVAHDFNNLLAVIIHSAAFALADLGDHPAAKEIKEIEKAAQRAVELTRQLLMIGRQERTSARVLQVGPLIADVEPDVRRVLGDRIRLEIDVDANPVVRVDPDQLHQALVSLVVNAAEAMPEGGRLRVRARERTLGRHHEHGDLAPGPYVALSITDDGAGMSEEVRLRALDPFFTSKPKGSATGLGLTTAYGIVKQNLGHLELASEPGVGTTVTIFLPVADEAVDEAPAPVTARPTAAARVLVVEDEDGVRRVAERILREGGYEVIALARSEEAPAHVPEVDVVLTDIVMPGMQGTELAAVLRKSHPELPVIFMSGYTDRPGRLPPGARFIGKPFSREELLAAVADALAGKGGP